VTNQVTSDEAKSMVLSCYPDACCVKWGIGRNSGLTFIILSGNITLGRTFRSKNHAMSIEIFEGLTWKKASWYIEREMLRKLES
jgi:hypothetical protein